MSSASGLRGVARCKSGVSGWGRDARGQASQPTRIAAAPRASLQARTASQPWVREDLEGVLEAGPVLSATHGRHTEGTQSTLRAHTATIKGGSVYAKHAARGRVVLLATVAQAEVCRREGTRQRRALEPPCSDLRAVPALPLARELRHRGCTGVDEHGVAANELRTMEGGVGTGGEGDCGWHDGAIFMRFMEDFKASKYYVVRVKWCEKTVCVRLKWRATEKCVWCLRYNRR